MTGLPKNAVADDLLAVFNGLEMLGEGIHLVMEDTDCTGEAYVELVSEAWAKKAVSRSGALITCAMGVAGTVHPVPVEIRRSSAAQLKAAFLMDGESDDRSSGKRSGGSQKSAGADAQFFIRVRGIDERIQTEEIQNLFEGFNIRDDDVKFLPQLAGNGASSASEHRPTAERVARVAFQTKESRDAALANKQLALSGASITVEDGGSEKRARSSSSGKAAGLMPDATASNVVRMRGLPYASDDNDIAQFFKGYPIAPGGISRGKDRHGRASGEAWVTFVNLEDAEEVVAKLDKAHMGNRYIELKF